MVDIISDITYESEEDILLPTENIDYIFKQIEATNPNHLVWIQYLKQWYSNNDSQFLPGWEINYDIKNLFEVEFKFINCGIVRAHFKWEISKKEPYFPNSPPKMYWLGPRYDWKYILQFTYFRIFIPSQWNLCHDLNKILTEISNITTSITLKEHQFVLTSFENNVLAYIKLTGNYPQYENSTDSLPTFGIVTEKKTDGGTGYSASIADDSFRLEYDTYDKKLANIISNINNELTTQNINILVESGLFKYLEDLIKATTSQEFEVNLNTYYEIYKLYQTDIIPNKNAIQLQLYNLWEEVEDTTEMESSKIDLIRNFIKNYNIVEYTDIHDDVEEDDEMDDIEELEDDTMTIENINRNYLKEMQSKQCLIIDKWEIETKNPNYHSFNPIKETLTPKWLKRLRREWKDLPKNCTLNGLYGNINVAWCVNDPSRWKLLITPSSSTPYSYGVFIFDMLIPADYPRVSPQMKFLTTGNGKVRFNPNLYNCGKVCLSLLGTWSGEPWNPNVSNLTQLFLSILAMIFVEDPYFNEPGYQSTQGTPEGDEKSKDYNQHIRYSTFKYAVYEPICSPDKNGIFEDLIINHFKLIWSKAKEEYQKWINEEKKIIHKEEMKKWLVEIENKLN